MKDIDFDELDRAVSSALQTGATPSPVAEAAPVQAAAPVVITDNGDTNAVSSTAPLQPSPAASLREVSPAQRRGGRFMDVVHPSSDMKTAAPAVVRVPRKPLAPVTPDFKAPDTVDTVTTPEPIAVQTPQAVVQAPAVTPPTPEDFPTLDTLPPESSPRIDTKEDAVPDEASSQTHSWPDPLDVSSDTIESPVTTETVPSEAPTIPEDDEPTEATPDIDDVSPPPVTTTDPTQTPFLADTKVDKRPLGAFADGDMNEEPATVATVYAPSALPPELDSSLVEIEAKETLTTEVPVEDKVASVPQATSVATVPVSIPQQYQAEEKFAESDAHAIFDTSAYHQPLLPQKTHGKSRAWIWVLIIVSLLIVGAGLGALFFMAGF